ncbi:MAG: hypothetical protein SGJ24_03030 [Chloroflexota bacterium]|nr:hypothetical protein [Chloroflexota bacterium]
MLKRFDRSPAIARLLETLSSSLARQRGLPVVIGVILIAISFIIQLIDLAVGSPVLALLWSITHHVGLITAFIGILMIEPLGR